MIGFDVHIHSDYSTDSKELPERMIEKAIETGLNGICFTDHMDLHFPEKCSKRSGGDFTFDVSDYFEKMEILKEKYKDRIRIFIGMEIGLRNEEALKDSCISEYGELAKRFPFDFIIGSTHCLEDIDPYWEEYWDGRTAEEGLDRYFDAIDQNISGYSDFDSLGHLDYLVRYVPEKAAVRSMEKRNLTDLVVREKGLDPSEKRFYGKWLYSPGDYWDRIEEILKKTIAMGKALEVNTAGLKYGLGFQHPKDEILKRYLELGGELITVGSDAHMADHLAYDFDNVCELLKSMGYKYYHIYKERKPLGYRL